MNDKIESKNEIYDTELLKKYNAKEKIVYSNGIIGLVDKEYGNVNNFLNKEKKFLFNVVGIIEDLGVNKYKELLKKIGYKGYVDNNGGYYHMINIKTNKEIPQESIKYYEIFEILGKVDYRLDVTKNIFAADNVIKGKDSSQKKMGLELSKLVNDELLVGIWVEKGVIKPFEINYLNHQKQLSDQETKKYLKQTLTFEYLSNLINNQAIDLVGEQGSIPVTLDGKTYEITFGPITKQELDYYKAKNLINKKMYEELLKILEEHKKLEERKKKEEEKHIEATKQEISGLKGEVEK